MYSSVASGIPNQSGSDSKIVLAMIYLSASDTIIFICILFSHIVNKIFLYKFIIHRGLQLPNLVSPRIDIDTHFTETQRFIDTLRPFIFHIRIQHNLVKTVAEQITNQHTKYDLANATILAIEHADFNAYLSYLIIYNAIICLHYTECH